MVSREQVEKAQSDNAYTYGNTLLYKMCSDAPYHQRMDIIIAKTMIIGRTYAAALERRKPKSDETSEPKIINDDFYATVVAKQFKNSKIDNYFSKLGQIQGLDTSNDLQLTIEAHGYLTNLTSEISGMRKRSFASKYLHFHFPNLFFLFDDRARKALVGLPKPPRAYLFDLNSIRPVDTDYLRFFRKCHFLTEHIEQKFHTCLSPRELDQLLLEIANEKMRTKS